LALFWIGLSWTSASLDDMRKRRRILENKYGMIMSSHKLNALRVQIQACLYKMNKGNTFLLTST